jgi:pilus assembly protein Flp/PilA
MFKKLMKFVKEEEGASAVEYGILVAAVAAIIITVMLALGGKTNNAMNATEQAMSTAPFTS